MQIVSEKIKLDLRGKTDSRDEIPKVFLMYAHLIDRFNRDAWKRDSRSPNPEKT